MLACEIGSGQAQTHSERYESVRSLWLDFDEPLRVSCLSARLPIGHGNYLGNNNQIQQPHDGGPHYVTNLRTLTLPMQKTGAGGLCNLCPPEGRRMCSLLSVGGLWYIGSSKRADPSSQ